MSMWVNPFIPIAFVYIDVISVTILLPLNPAQRDYHDTLW